MREGRLGAAVQGPLVAIGGANDEILMNQSSGAAGCPGGGGPAASTTRRRPKPVRARCLPHPRLAWLCIPVPVLPRACSHQVPGP